MTEAAVIGIALWGPGLPGWEGSRDIMAGRTPIGSAMPDLPASALLGPAERRRASPVVRLALHLAEQASAAAGIASGAVASVFATSNGEGALLGALLETLARDNAPISPTQFHNSVHNAAAGYWTIGAQSRAPFTCLACHDASVGAALLQAAAQVAGTSEPVLCVCYDLPLPPPLDALRPIAAPFGFGLVLSPVGMRHAPLLHVQYVTDPAVETDWRPTTPGLRALAGGNPAARGLRLLEALARQEAISVRLPMLDGSVAIEIALCSTALPSCA